MENQNRVCPICGEELSENGVCARCNINYSSTRDQDSEHGKKKKLWVSILSTVLAVIVGTAVGNFFTKGNDIEKQIDEYIAKVEQYVPGTVEDDVYTSESFGITFNKNKKWKMFNEEELAEVSRSVKESTRQSIEKSLDNEKINEELKQKCREAIYVETEMAASYIEDNTYVGQMMVGIIGVPGTDDVSMKEYAQTMEKAINDTGIKDTKIGKGKLGGNEYDTLYISINQDGDIVKTVYYFTKKEGMICMITLQYLEEYEDTVLNELNAAIA